jgi:hypothetical protein
MFSEGLSLFCGRKSSFRGIPRSTEESILSQNALEQTSESLLLFLFHETEFLEMLRNKISKVCSYFCSTVRKTRREIITVRVLSYFSRLPKYWPPIPLSAPPLLRGEDTLAGRRGGGSIFWKTREIELPSYSNNLSTENPSILLFRGMVLNGILRDF